MLHLNISSWLNIVTFHRDLIDFLMIIRMLIILGSQNYGCIQGGGGTGGRLPLFEPREFCEIFLKLTYVLILGEFALSVLISYWFSA